MTKKQRGDAPPKGQPPKGNGESDGGSKVGRGADGAIEANSTTKGMEDCLQVKSIKTENSVVRSSSMQSRQFFRSVFHMAGRTFRYFPLTCKRLS